MIIPLTRHIWCVAAAVSVLGCQEKGQPVVNSDHAVVNGVRFTKAEFDELSQFYLEPRPAGTPDPTNRFDRNGEAVSLGRELFTDARLSSSGTISCASCHSEHEGWGDGKPVAELRPGVKGARNVPSLLNVRAYHWYGWDGGHNTLWGQCTDPLLDPEEHALTVGGLKKIIQDDSEYSKGYAALVGTSAAGDDDYLVAANVGKFLAAYVGGIGQEATAWDRFIDFGKREFFGEAVDFNFEAVSANALKGAKLFVGKGSCVSCHSGPYLTNSEFHNLRIRPLDGSEVLKDAARFEGIAALRSAKFAAGGAFSDDKGNVKARLTTGLVLDEGDWGAFRTPSLRNNLRTAPYMHQGMFATLEEVVDFYSDQKDVVKTEHVDELTMQKLEFTKEEKAQVVSFLKSLN